MDPKLTPAQTFSNRANTATYVSSELLRACYDVVDRDEIEKQSFQTLQCIAVGPLLELKTFEINY